MYELTLLDERGIHIEQYETSKEAYEQGMNIINDYCQLMRTNSTFQFLALSHFTESYHKNPNFFFVHKRGKYTFSVVVEKIKEESISKSNDTSTIKISKEEFKDKFTKFQLWYYDVEEILDSISNLFGEQAKTEIYHSLKIDYIITLFEELIGDKKHCINAIAYPCDFDFYDFEQTLVSSTTFEGTDRPEVYNVDSFYDYIEWINREGTK